MLTWQLHCGSALEVLKTLPDQSVNCCVSSPPYYQQRDYQVAGQIGREESPQEYVAAIVDVFAGCRRVLSDDGTCWINLGDGFQDKQLLGIPWSVAFALRNDGWYLRSEIIWHKKSCRPESVKDRPTKAHEQVFLLAKGQWKSRVVKFSDLPCQRFHFSQYFRANGLPVRGAARLPVDLAAAIFDSAQRENQFSLPPFYSEVWQQQSDGSDSEFVRRLPIEDRAPVWAARFICSHVSAEDFLSEIQRLWVTHPRRDDLCEGWASADAGPDAPSISGNRKGTVTVHYPGEICEVDFAGHSVILSRPRSCDYFYDADAIREKYAESTLEQIKAGYDGEGQKDYASAGVQNPSGVKSRMLNAMSKRYAAIPGQTVHGSMARGERFMSTSQPGANARSVWSLGPEPATDIEHFAVMPKTLARRCILAGCPFGGVVLDPFAGSGTTCIVALEEGRNTIGIELNPAYHELARERLANVAPLLAQEIAS